MAKLPSIVVVPGAFHVPSHFQRVTTLLEDHGYKVAGVTFPEPGKWHTQDVSFEDLVACVRKVVADELQVGNDVLLVVHSASGLSGLEAIDGLAKKKGSSEPGVIGIFAIAAIFGRAGYSLSDLLYGGGSSWFRSEGDALYPADFDAPGEAPKQLGPSPCSPAVALYNDMSEKDQKEAYDALVPIFLTTFTGKTKSEDWRGLPLTYVITAKDNALFPILQGGLIVGLDYPVEIKRINASHSPFLSQPVVIADWIVEAASQIA